MSLGQRNSTNPTAMLASLMGKRERLQEELRSIEKQVYELETSYLQDSSHFGNVFKGFEGFLSSSKNATNLKRSRKFQPEDRLFSLSSVTSPAAVSHMQNVVEIVIQILQDWFVHFVYFIFRLKNLELDVMMEDLILVQVGLRVEPYLPMDRPNQRREEPQHQEMERGSGHQVKQILMMKMILI